MGDKIVKKNFIVHIYNFINVDMTVDLIAPVALEKGTKFSIREGGRTVGAGVVSEIVE